MFTFIHAADIHLDSPLRGLEAYDGAPVDAIRNASRRALENLVQLCLDENAAFLLVAGDLYDGGWDDYGTGLFFARQMDVLDSAGIPVFIVRGNHDANERMTRDLQMPGNVHIFPADAPATHLLDSVGAAVHGQSFARVAVTDDLAADYPAAVPGRFNVGLLHTALTGRPGHDNYAPCNPAELTARGYQYWALGHVHAREIVQESPAWIVFSGCLQGRHARETGAKGATVVRVDDGQVTAVMPRELDVVRWEQLAVDVTGIADQAALLAAVEDSLAAAVAVVDGPLLAARVRLHGACPLHGELLARRESLRHEFVRLAGSVAPGRLWLEKVVVATERPPAAAAGGDGAAELVDLVAALSPDDLRAPFERLRRFVPPAFLGGGGEPDLDTAAAYEQALAEARELLRERLQVPEAES